MIPPNLSNFYISKYVSRSSRSFGNQKETYPIPWDDMSFWQALWSENALFVLWTFQKAVFWTKNAFSNHSACQKHMSSQVRQSCTLVWDKLTFDFQNFEKILRHILKYRNCSNLEGSFLSTIKSCGEKIPEFVYRLIRLVYIYMVIGQEFFDQRIRGESFGIYFSMGVEV